MGEIFLEYRPVLLGVVVIVMKVEPWMGWDRFNHVLFPEDRSEQNMTRSIRSFDNTTDILRADLRHGEVVQNLLGSKGHVAIPGYPDDQR